MGMMIVKDENKFRLDFPTCLPLMWAVYSMKNHFVYKNTDFYECSKKTEQSHFVSVIINSQQ
jgi:hypothetical protein